MIAICLHPPMGDSHFHYISHFVLFFLNGLLDIVRMHCTTMFFFSWNFELLFLNIEFQHCFLIPIFSPFIIFFGENLLCKYNNQFHQAPNKRMQNYWPFVQNIFP